MIELKAMRLFVALADELHFGRTANRLGIAQSALSTQVLRIEDRLGALLFDRGRRSAVSLTQVGRIFLVEARAAIAQVERAERIGRMAGRGEAGPARIGYVLSAALSGALPNALSAIRQSLPMLAIEAQPMDTPDQLAALAEGRLDLGFIRPRPSYPLGVEVAVVHREQLLIALSSEHPLAGQPRVIAADLAGETFIVPQFGASEGFSDAVARLCTSGRFDPAPIVRTRDFITAISLAAARYGIVLAPSCMGNLQMSGIAFRQLADHRVEVDLLAAWGSTASPRLLDVVLPAPREH